jgi:hypothetical protein
MGFLKNLLNPFGDNNNKKEYKDISKESQRVTPNPPSELLLYCRDIAGEQIQTRMGLLNDCRWIRAEYTYPAFDSMCFIYKNAIFSVIIDIQDEEGTSYIPEEFIKRQLYAARTYNLIPCKFSVVVPHPQEPDLKEVKPKTDGWNLFNTETGEEIIPEHSATEEKVKISDWEIRNLSIRFVMKYLQAKKLHILSFQDTLEVDPQIWFQDKDGRKCWLIIRSALAPEKEVKKPEKLKEIIRRCFKNDGYYAGVILAPVNDDENDINLYRNGNVKINFVNFEKVHSTL